MRGFLVRAMMVAMGAWVLAAAAPTPPAAAETADTPPVRVEFPSLDGKTRLVGYVFSPAGPGRHPAVVMMHGRAGAYSSRADGRYDATTLTKRHAFWGHFWADQGYVAVLVDGFGPRGYPNGFPAHSYADRPAVLDETTVRPLDAYGALAYLRTRVDVDGARVALQGWSNGGSATLASMSDTTLRQVGLKPSQGFKGALAFYPACGLHGQFQTDYNSYAPLRIFSGDADEEVSAEHCRRLVAAARPNSDETITIFSGATHDFDDPGRKRQGVPANAEAARQAIPAARAFVAHLFAR